MPGITATTRFAGLITLSYSNGACACEDRLYAANMNMWRDIFPGGAAEMLAGKTAGDVINVGLEASGQGQLNRNSELVRPVDRARIARLDSAGDRAALSPGRYYPQNILKGVPGVFSATMSPCRLVRIDDKVAVFDLNHPLAGRRLHFSLAVEQIFPPVKERGGRCEDWLELAAADGPGMQCPHETDAAWEWPPGWNAREDESDDGAFYRRARLVQHLDARARRIIGAEYAALAGRGARVVDLMASWDSHFPPSAEIDLTVLGLNGEELEANRRATARLVQDLNADKELPWPEASFDLAVCTASIEYLTDPQAFTREIARILRPGGKAAISFSNRWFPTKAIALWSELHDFEKMGLVRRLLAEAGLRALTTLSVRGYPRPEDDPHPEIPFADPVYLVSATKPDRS